MRKVDLVLVQFSPQLQVPLTCSMQIAGEGITIRAPEESHTVPFSCELDRLGAPDRC